MRIETVTVTPELAATWLERNTRNRPLSQHTVNKYAKDMAAGRWVINGETIKLNGDVVVDGQHRLWACVQSGVSFVSVVVFELPGDVFDTIDAGRPRRASDALSIAGYVNARTLAGVVRIVLAADADAANFFSIHTPPAMIRRWCEVNPSVVDSCNKGRAYYQENRSVTPSAWGAADFLLSRLNDPSTAPFLERVCKGIGIAEGTWEYALRRSLTNQTRSSSGGIADVAKICKAWNGIALGQRPPVVIRWITVGDRRESFPHPKAMRKS
jgi:hypothetical protein